MLSVRRFTLSQEGTDTKRVSTMPLFRVSVQASGEAAREVLDDINCEPEPTHRFITLARVCRPLLESHGYLRGHHHIRANLQALEARRVLLLSAVQWPLSDR